MNHFTAVTTHLMPAPAISAELISREKLEYLELRAPVAAWLATQAPEVEQEIAAVVDDDPEMGATGYAYGFSGKGASASKPDLESPREDEDNVPIYHTRSLVIDLDKLFALVDPAAPLSPKWQRWQKQHRMPQRSKGELLIHWAYRSAHYAIEDCISSLKGRTLSFGDEWHFNNKNRRRLINGKHRQIKSIVEQLSDETVDDFPAGAVLELSYFVSNRLLCFLHSEYVYLKKGRELERMAREYNRSITLHSLKYESAFRGDKG